MIKRLLLAFVLFTADRVHAESTSPSVLAGSIANLWTQAALRVTDKPFDLGVQGAGFFVLQLPSGEQVFSRYGELSLNAEGFLLHSSSGGKILGYCSGELQPINLSGFARDPEGAAAESFKIELNGTMNGSYENGKTHGTCTVALALFNNPLKLGRQHHVLRPTVDSGFASIGKPQSDGRGSVYGATLEELDETMYRVNSKSGTGDRVAEEMKKSRAAAAQWSKEKTLFYVYDLDLTREELSGLDQSTERVGVEIQKIVALAEMGPHQISDTDFSAKIQFALKQHEREVADILGQVRLATAKKFREEFNRNVWGRFGSTTRFTAF